MDKKFYVYVWYDVEGTPIYVGKGCHKRAFRNKDVSVSIFKDGLSEKEAFEVEKELIRRYGRRDKQTGTLQNLTDGGGITFSSLYWSGEELKARHAKGLKKRSEEWRRGRQKHCLEMTQSRPADWQDSVYLIKEPQGKIIELKTQDMKEYANTNNLDFNQLKHIARGNITKRQSNRHYGFRVACLYNKVTKQTLDRADVIKGWQK